MKIVLTLGAEGAVYADQTEIIRQSGFPVTAIDSTGAGDTFTGYFLAGVARGASIQDCISEACKAASLSVTRNGAATSIPDRAEILS